MGRAVIRFDVSLFLELCKPGTRTLKIESEVPLDAKLVGTDYSPLTDTYLLAFESDSLEETPISQKLLELEPPRVYLINLEEN